MEALNPKCQSIKTSTQVKRYFNLIQVGTFWGLLIDGGGEGGEGAKRSPLPKLCHTNPIMMELGTVISYLQKSQKYMNHVTHSLNGAYISIFHRKSANFGISENTDIDCILVHNF